MANNLSRITASAGITLLTGTTNDIQYLRPHLSASAVATPNVGQMYYDTVLNKFYGCLTAGNWTEFSTGGTPSLSDGILDWSTNTYAPYAAQQGSILSFDTSSTDPTRTDRLNLNGNLYATNMQAFTYVLRKTGSTYQGTFTPPVMNTAARTWTLPDKDGTFAMLSDLGGAANVTLADDVTDTTNWIPFANDATGAQALKTNSSLIYNANTGALGVNIINPASGTTVTIDNLTSASTVNIATGVATGATAKTVNIGTGSTTAGTTAINMGTLAASGNATTIGLSYTTLNLNGTGMSSTGTQLNYLNGATGTTGGTSTLVFNTSPTFATSIIGSVAMDLFNTISTSINFGSAVSGTMNIGVYAGAQTINIGTGANAAATKALNLGTNTANNGTTTISIGDTGGSTGTSVTTTIGSSSAATSAIALKYTAATGLTLNGTALSTTATRLNYLTSASGTTGTASTNIVFSTSPTFTTSVLTDSTTFGLFDATATTINFAGAATTLNIGYDGTTGTSVTNINTGVNTAGSKTINIGTDTANGGTAAINIGTTAGTTTTTTGTTIGSTSANVSTIALNYSASGLTLNGTAMTTTATRLNYLTSAGGTTGTTSTNLVFSTSPAFATSITGSASMDVFHTGSTTLNIGGAATTLTLGSVYNTADGAAYSIVTANTYSYTANLFTGATQSGKTKTINIGTNGVGGSATAITIGAAAGTSTINLQGTVSVSGVALSTIYAAAAHTHAGVAIDSTGTDQDYFQINANGTTNGVRLTANAGVLEIKANDGNTFADLKVKNLTVTGTTTQIDSNTVNIGDSNIVLNSDVAAIGDNSDGGITVKRVDAGAGDKSAILNFNNSTGRWDVTFGAVTGTLQTKAIAVKSVHTITGTNAAKTYALTHSLNTSDVSVMIIDTYSSSSYYKQVVMADVTVTDANTVTIDFAANVPTSQTYNVVIVG